MDAEIEELIGPARNSPRQLKDMGPLQALLLRCYPRDEDDTASIPRLARKMGLTPESIYKWIRANEIDYSRARAIVELSSGRATLSDFEPYLK